MYGYIREMNSTYKYNDKTSRSESSRPPGNK